MASAADRAYEHLKDAILSGELQGGERLREERLAAELGVSRTPVREALRRLGAIGLVLIDTHRGAQVASWTEQDIDEIYAIRSVLEPYGARLAASFISDEDLDHLTEMMDEMERRVSSGPQSRERIEQSTELNIEFHRYILQASGNSRLASAFSQIAEFPVLFRAYQHFSPVRVRESLAEHRVLVHAFRERDSEWAESVMREHVLAARAEQRRLFRDLTFAQIAEGNTFEHDLG